LKGIKLNQASLRRIISGENKSLCAAALRGLMRVLSYIYAAVIAARNLLYDKGLLKSHRPEAAVISIGNITTGGTGKTPMVIWVYNFLQQHNTKCSILTRGYKTEKSGEDIKDEPFILEKNCPQAKVIVDSDRVKSAKKAVEQYNSKAIILDDGFQHRHLARDIDIVCIDASCPFGYGKILPAGFLRENLSQLKRADAVILTRTDQQSSEKIHKIIEKIKNYNPEIITALSSHKIAKILTGENRELPADAVSQKKVYAFCGIGNPDAFFNSLKSLGAELAGTKVFDDHHNYNSDDLKNIRLESEKYQAEMIITTEKDFIKLDMQNSGLKNKVGMLKVEIEFTEGEQQLKQLIEKKI
jgi:tetraacyldisaccharide 4'-kinase